MIESKQTLPCSEGIARSDDGRRHRPPGAEVASIESTSGYRSVTRFVALLFGLCIPVWAIGAMWDIELFPGFKLFQAGLAMPMVAALILTYQERRWAGITSLLRRTYDVGKIRPRMWLLPMLLLFPSFGALNYGVLQLAGANLPAPTFSLITVLG